MLVTLRVVRMVTVLATLPHVLAILSVHWAPLGVAATLK